MNWDEVLRESNDGFAQSNECVGDELSELGLAATMEC